ncbi:MAG: hypothetical protein AB7F89_05810 [Pirellulaceae bacterium]
MKKMLWLMVLCCISLPMLTACGEPGQVETKDAPTQEEQKDMENIGKVPG